MELLEELQSLYTGYLLKTAQLERDRQTSRRTGWAWGSGPAADPCHDRFAQELEALLHRMDSLPSSQLFQALSFIYTAPFAHRDNPSAYWMLQAVHGLTVPLIPRLSPGGCAGPADPVPGRLSPLGTIACPEAGPGSLEAQSIKTARGHLLWPRAVSFPRKLPAALHGSQVRAGPHSPGSLPLHGKTPPADWPGAFYWI